MRQEIERVVDKLLEQGPDQADFGPGGSPREVVQDYIAFARKDYG